MRGWGQCQNSAEGVFGSAGTRRAVVWLLAFLIVWASGSFAADPVGQDSFRFAEVAIGQAHLDAGDNHLAGTWAASLFRQDPSRLEILDILMVAAGRMCAQDSVLAHLDAQLDADDAHLSAALFLAGSHFRADYDFQVASEKFRHAATIALDRGDTVSAVAAWFQAADCLITVRETGPCLNLLAEIEVLLQQNTCPPRWMEELRIRRARAQLLKGDNAEAYPVLEKVLESAEASGQRGLVCSSFDLLAATQVQRNNRLEAIELYERSLAEADVLGDVYHQCRMLLNLAYNTGGREGSPGPGFLDEAEKRILGCGNQYLLGHVDGTRAVFMENQIRRQEAIVLFQSSAEHHAAVGNKGGEMGARQRMAFNMAMQGRFLEAQENYETCLDLMEGQESGWVANWVLWGLANVHRNLGNLDEALDYYNRALAVGRGLGSLSTVAGNLSELGLTHAMLGRYHQAILLQHEALDIRQELGQTRGSARIHARIGDAYFHLGNLNLALDHFQQSYELTKDAEGPELLSDAVGGLALIHGQAGDHDRAADGFREALEIARRLDDQEAIVWALISLAEQQVLAGRTEAAETTLAEVEPLLTDGGHFHDRALIGLLKADIADDPEKSLLLASEALTAAREGGLPADEWKCHSEIGRYRLAVGDTAGARAGQLAAMEGVESLWLKVGAEELRRHLLGAAGLPYERMVELLLDSGGDVGRAREALAFAERSRARVFAHRLAVAGAQAPDWMGGGLSDEEKEVAAAIAMRQSRLQEAGLRDAERSSIKTEIRVLEEDFRMLRLASANPAETVLSGPANENPDLLGGLKPGETALFFFLGVERSFLFMAEEKGVQAWELAAKEEIETRVRLFLGLWTQMNGRDPGPDAVADFQAAAGSLFAHLFGPAAGEMASARHLVIIPDGLLHRLPFAALRDEQGVPLGERNIFLAPSLEVLARLRADELPQDDDPDRKNLDVIAVGCGLNGESGKGGERVNPFTGRLLGRLPHAEDEARMVAGMFDYSLLLTGNQATEEGFRKLAGYHTDILHIAAHGVADENEVRRSFIVINLPMESGDSTRLDDGILQWYEVSDLSLDAGLVILSSCSSAAGVLARGEGVTGLTQAFLFAGSRCVLATLTEVPDNYAAGFMEEFYRGLRQGWTAASALSKAQGKARRGELGLSERPLWAAFTLVGDGGISVEANTPGFGGWTSLKVVALLGLVVGAWMGLRRRKS